MKNFRKICFSCAVLTLCLLNMNLIAVSASTGTFGASLQWELTNNAMTIVASDSSYSVMYDGTIYMMKGTSYTEDSFDGVFDAYYDESNQVLVDYLDAHTINEAYIDIEDIQTPIRPFMNISCSRLTISENVTHVVKGGFYAFNNTSDVYIYAPNLDLTHTMLGCSNEDEPEYDITLHGYAGSTTEAYANAYGFRFIALEEEKTILGDINGDGEFSVVDVILLQKWLLGASDIEPINWKAADFCDDGLLNIYDLILMKKALLAK